LLAEMPEKGRGRGLVQPEPFDQRLLAKERRGPAEEDGFSLRQRQEAVGSRPGKGHVVGDEDHRGVVRPAPGIELVQDAAGGGRVQAGRGFVEEQRPGRQGQGDGDGHRSLLASGQVERRALEVNVGRQAYVVQGPGYPLVDLLRG